MNEPGNPERQNETGQCLGRIGDHPQTLRHRCASRGCYLQRHAPNWRCIGDLPDGMSVMDVDGVLEHRGHFLWLEYKGPDGLLSVGESLTLEALARCPGHTVLVIRAKRPTMSALMNGTAGTAGSIEELGTGVVTHTGDVESLLRGLINDWLGGRNSAE